MLKNLTKEFFPQEGPKVGPKKGNFWRRAKIVSKMSVLAHGKWAIFFKKMPNNHPFWGYFTVFGGEG